MRRGRKNVAAATLSGGGHRRTIGETSRGSSAASNAEGRALSSSKSRRSGSAKSSRPRSFDDQAEYKIPSTNSCKLCSQTITAFCKGPSCEHFTCAFCAMKLRKFYGKERCIICRAPQRICVFTWLKNTNFEEFELDNVGSGIAEQGVCFEDRDVVGEGMFLQDFGMKHRLHGVLESTNAHVEAKISKHATRKEAICMIMTDDQTRFRGTAFYVKYRGHDCVMTAHHVLPGPRSVAGAVAEFGYFKGGEPFLCQLSTSFFLTNATAGYSIVALCIDEWRLEGEVRETSSVGDVGQESKVEREEKEGKDGVSSLLIPLHPNQFRTDAVSLQGYEDEAVIELAQCEEEEGSVCASKKAAAGHAGEDSRRQWRPAPLEIDRDAKIDSSDVVQISGYVNGDSFRVSEEAVLGSLQEPLVGLRTATIDGFHGSPVLFNDSCFGMFYQTPQDTMANKIMLMRCIFDHADSIEGIPSVISGMLARLDSFEIQ